MRKLFFAVLVTIAMTMQAQNVKENELALVYYMPQTELAIEVHYEKEVRSAGIFAAYAKQYLGTDEAIMEDEVRYRITEVTTGTRTSADKNRMYKVLPDATMQTQYLCLNNKGILAGYNIPLENEKQKNASKSEQHNEAAHRHTAGRSVMPLTEDALNAGSVSEMARLAAKQIFHLRDTRLYILSGEVEHTPADGTAMKRVLAELDKQEEELVNLFIGTRTITRSSKTYYVLPEKSGETALLYFSEDNGITQEEDASAQPVVLRMVAHKQMLEAGNAQPDKKAPQPSQIYYNLPGSVDYTVLYKDRTLAERQIPVAQFGIAIPLAKSVFSGKKLPHIHINTKTGAILSIAE